MVWGAGVLLRIRSHMIIFGQEMTVNVPINYIFFSILGGCAWCTPSESSPELYITWRCYHSRIVTPSISNFIFNSSLPDSKITESWMYANDINSLSFVIVMICIHTIMLCYFILNMCDLLSSVNVLWGNAIFDLRKWMTQYIEDRTSIGKFDLITA